MHTEIRAIIKKRKKRKKSHLLFPLLSPVSLCVGQSETHSAGGLRKHEDGGRLHSKARASGLRFTHNERVGGWGAEEWRWCRGAGGQSDGTARRSRWRWKEKGEEGGKKKGGGREKKEGRREGGVSFSIRVQREGRKRRKSIAGRNLSDLTLIFSFHG